MTYIALSIFIDVFFCLRFDIPVVLIYIRILRFATTDQIVRGRISVNTFLYLSCLFYFLSKEFEILFFLVTYHRVLSRQVPRSYHFLLIKSQNSITSQIIISRSIINRVFVGLTKRHAIPI